MKLQRSVPLICLAANSVAEAAGHLAAEDAESLLQMSAVSLHLDGEDDDCTSSKCKPATVPPTTVPPTAPPTNQPPTTQPPTTQPPTTQPPTTRPPTTQPPTTTEAGTPWKPGMLDADDGWCVKADTSAANFNKWKLDGEEDPWTGSLKKFTAEKCLQACAEDLKIFACEFQNAYSQGMCWAYGEVGATLIADDSAASEEAAGRWLPEVDTKFFCAVKK